MGAATDNPGGVSNADAMDCGNRLTHSRRCEFKSERSPPALRLPALSATARTATEATPPSSRCADSRRMPLDCATASEMVHERCPSSSSSSEVSCAFAFAVASSRTAAGSSCGDRCSRFSSTISFK